MKKHIFFLLIILIFGSKITAQDKDSNIIISIDQEVHPAISNMYILDGLKKYYISYEPGRFLIKELDLKELQNNKAQSLKLVLSNNIDCPNSSSSKMYEIEDFKLSWLDQRYLILNIYNTDNKKYKKIYNPLPGKSYTYDYDYPGGTIKRVQKSFTKEQKQCQ